MKRILLALLAFVSFAASAETILLVPTPGFGALREFFNIPNDGGYSLTLYSNLTYPTQHLYINGDIYSGPNLPTAVLTDSLGATLTLVSSYTSHTTCYRKNCSTVWTLQGQSIVR